MKIKNYEDLKQLDSCQIYTLLRNFDLCIGEDFLDYNENFINKANLLFYLLGNGTIDTEMINYCVSNKLLTKSDLNELFDVLGILYNERLKILADISVNLDALLKRLYNSYIEFDLDFTISEDLINKIKPELQNLY